MDAPRQKQLMGAWMTGALVVGSMIGAGIFLLPVSLAPLGVNAIVGWLVSICGAVAIAFSLAQLTSAGGGGIQSYIEQAFGPMIGFVVTWSFWCSCWVANAAIAIAFGSALARISPALASPNAIVATGIAAIAFLTAVNAWGVRASGGLNLLTVAIKVLPLLGVIALLASTSLSGAPLEPLATSPLTIANVAAAATLTLFALTGFENATAPVGKVRDPERTLPRAILAGTASVGVIYLLASSGVTFLVPSSLVASSPAPYADVFGSRFGEGVVLLAALAIAVSAFGCLNCGVLACGELGYAMALRRQLPAAMARTRGANTPVMAQLVSAVLAILLVLANSSRATASLFTFVILLATSAVLILYLTGALAAWLGSRSGAGRAVIGLALGFIAFAFYGAGAEANLWCLVLVAIGLVVNAAMRALSSRESSPAPEAVPAEPRG